MKPRKPLSLPGIDGPAVLREALRLVERRLDAPARRAFLARGLTLGGLAMLSGCSLSDNESAEKALGVVSRWNDRVQAWLFDPDKLAPTYPESMITRPFPFNAYYGIDEVRHVDEESFRLEVSGLVADKRQWRLDELRRMAQIDQVTRHICVEGWSAIGKWGGVPFSAFLKRVGADLSARYVGFKCADDYYTSIDMPTALHAQTILALTYDGKTLPPEYGFPMKLRMPTSLDTRTPSISRRSSSPTPTGRLLGGPGLQLVRRQLGGSRSFLPHSSPLKEIIMKTLTTAAFSLCLAFGAVAAHAADDMSKDGMQKSGMSKDAMGKDGMKKDGMAKDAMSKDGMSKDGMSKGGMAKDGMSKDGMSKDGMSKAACPRTA